MRKKTNRRLDRCYRAGRHHARCASSQSLSVQHAYLCRNLRFSGHRPGNADGIRRTNFARQRRLYRTWSLYYSHTKPAWRTSGSHFYDCSDRFSACGVHHRLSDFEAGSYYLAIATLGFALLVQALAISMFPLTGGSSGMSVNSLTVFSNSLGERGYFILAWVIFGVGFILARI